MGEDVAMECENHFTLQPMPGSAHSSSCSNENAGQRNRRKHSINRCHHLNSSYDDFRGSSHDKLPDFHCKSMPSRTLEVIFEENVMLKRSSIYLTSSEVRRMRKLRKGRKLESSYNDDTLLPFEIVDSLLHRPSEAVHVSQQNQLSVFCINAEPESSSVSTADRITRRSMEFLDLSFRYLFGKHLKPDSTCTDLDSPKNDIANDLFEICIDSEDIKYPSKYVAPKLLEAGAIKDLKPDCCQILGIQTDRIIHNERDMACALPKSFSAKTRTHTSQYESEVVLNKVTTEGPFSPLKRIFDPIMRSKSMRSSSLKKTEAATVINPSIVKGNRVSRHSRKSLLNDFSKTTQNMEHNNWALREQHLEIPPSPAHLHAILKVEGKKGIQSFKFSMKDAEDILSAKAWKTENASKWVYTFHKKRINSIGRGTKDKYRHSPPVVGQMQLSCNPSSDVRENGTLDKFIEAEFILYDIAQARRSSAAEERTRCSLDFIQHGVAESLVAQGHLERENSMERQHHIRHSLSTWDSNASTCYPWSQEDLHPQLEIAAVVIQIPLNKKDSSKYIKEQANSKESPNLSTVTSVNQEREPIATFLYHDTVKVVIPSGTHGSPSCDVIGPLPLLDRWRFGGGCDCGGWDMACPVVVLDNPCGDDCVDYLMMENKKELVLFVQGNKEKIPALSINYSGKGQYSVNFHAQLSALQAFSICIAILHSSENSSAINEEVKHKLYSDSLKLLLAEEMKDFVETVAVEEKRNTKKVEQMFLDLPFSPMGRV
ncbi:uncharacterized protein [Typha latifolia]|uniref:uncharacterized protein n=1 Tax=Typha latifolia TaxID=4733 RepID=UPI003C302630